MPRLGWMGTSTAHLGITDRNVCSTKRGEGNPGRRGALPRRGAWSLQRPRRWGSDASARVDGYIHRSLRHGRQECLPHPKRGGMPVPPKGIGMSDLPAEGRMPVAAKWTGMFDAPEEGRDACSAGEGRGIRGGAALCPGVGGRRGCQAAKNWLLVVYL